MEPLGKFLKKKREEKNKSLEDIENATKIRKGLLDAIENDKYDLLPHPSYTRGFLKLYAKEIDISEDEVLHRYGEILNAAKPSAANTEITGRVHLLRVPSRHVIIMLLGFGVLLVYFLMRYSGGPNDIEPSVDQTAYNAAESLAVPVQDKAELPQEDSSVTFEPAAVIETEAPEDYAAVKEEFKVSFEARALVWIKIQIDQQEPFDIMLRPGEWYSNKACEAMNVRIGNAGGVSLYFNDVRLEDIGVADEVVNLTFPDAAEGSRPIE